MIHTMHSINVPFKKRKAGVLEKLEDKINLYKF